MLVVWGLELVWKVESVGLGLGEQSLAWSKRSGCSVEVEVVRGGSAGAGAGALVKPNSTRE